MKEFTLTIKNESGLHARPASLLAEKAQKYNSRLTILHSDGIVDAKSVVSILCGGISNGAEIKLLADGIDETAALEGVAAFILSLDE